MEQRENIEDCLNRKLAILEKIAANTDTQLRFIPRREMRGLRRVLRERDALLEGLVDVNRDLARNSGWKSMPVLAAKIQELALKQVEILARSRQALQGAIMERNRVVAELNSSRVGRNIKNRYVNHWTVMAQGCRINEKG